MLVKGVTTSYYIFITVLITILCVFLWTVQDLIKYNVLILR